MKYKIGQELSTEEIGLSIVTDAFYSKATGNIVYELKEIESGLLYVFKEKDINVIKENFE